MHKTALVLALSFALLSGCVSQATTQHVQGEEATHDGYCRLVEAALANPPAAGTPAQDAISLAQLQATPEPVRRLLQRTIVALYLSRTSWYSAGFGLGVSADPATMTFSQPPVFDAAAIGSGS